jgi:hypothetical protein
MSRSSQVLAMAQQGLVSNATVLSQFDLPADTNYGSMYRQPHPFANRSNEPVVSFLITDLLTNNDFSVPTPVVNIFMGKVQVGVIYEIRDKQGQSFFAADTSMGGRSPAVPPRECFEAIEISDLLQRLERDLTRQFRHLWTLAPDPGHSYISLSAPDRRDNGDIFHDVFIGSWRVGFTVMHPDRFSSSGYCYYANVWLGLHKILDGLMHEVYTSETFVATLNQTLRGSFQNFYEIHPKWNPRYQVEIALSQQIAENEDEAEDEIEDEIEEKIEDEIEEYEDEEDNTALVQNILSESDLEWQDYHLVGSDQYLRRAEPTQEFWDSWHQYKEELKAAKVFVTKEAGCWWVYDWQAAREIEHKEPKPVVTTPRVIVRPTIKVVEETVPEIVEEIIEPEIVEEIIEEVEPWKGDVITPDDYNKLLVLYQEYMQFCNEARAAVAEYYQA